MMFLTVLCLAVGALASPAVYVPRASLEYPWTYPLRSITIMDAEEAKLTPLSLEGLGLVKAFEIEALPEPGKEKEEGEKTEEGKEGMEGEMEGEKEIEKEKEELKPIEDPRKPILVKWDIQKLPEFLTNFWANLPNYFPHITFPPIFTRPAVAPVPVPATAADMAKYRLVYDYPFVAPTVRIIEKK